MSDTIEFKVTGSAKYSQNITTEGLAELEKVLKNLPAKVADRLLVRAIGSGTKQLAELIKAKILQLGHYDSGQLYNSVKNSPKINKRQLLVYSYAGPRGAPHAHLIEYGHKTKNGGHVPPSSYIRSTAIENSENLTDLVKQKLAEHIKKLEEK
jgi:hypothetical protein